MVRITFDKILHDTGKALLVRIGSKEHWIPKKLCKNILLNKKLSGSVLIPIFLAKKMEISFSLEKEITVHVPENKPMQDIEHDADLFK
jgi:hypothetical protein